MQKLCVILALSASLFTNNALAKDTIKLNKYIETTNIDTHNYIWYVTAHTTGVDDPDVQVELDNPHPTLIAYNKRALQIAQNKSYSPKLRYIYDDLIEAQIDEIIQNSTLPSELTSDDFKNISLPTEKSFKATFTLPIQFKQGRQIRPDFNRRFARKARLYMNKICYASDKGVSINLTYKVTVSGDGRAKQIKLLRNSSDNVMAPKYTHRPLRQIPIMYPYTENGVLSKKNISYILPIRLTCP